MSVGTRRWWVIVASVLLGVVVGGVLVARARIVATGDLERREAEAWAQLGTPPDPVPVPEVLPLDRRIPDGALLVSSRIPGDGYGAVERVEESGARRALGIDCDRVHTGGDRLLCLVSFPGIPGAGAASVHDLDVTGLPRTHRFAIGTPSRARIAADGDHIAVTSFVTGHSYLDVGEFATATLVGPPDEVVRADDLVVDSTDPAFGAVDANWWGASLVGDDVVVTHGAGGSTQLVGIDVATAAATPWGIAGSCPSLSPDGRLVVFKRDVAGAPLPRLVVRDLETGEERVLAEERFVDDQVEWLDDDTILYALPHGEASAIQPGADVWVLDLAPHATPSILVPFAASPSVHRRSG